MTEQTDQSQFDQGPIDKGGKVPPDIKPDKGPSYKSGFLTPEERTICKHIAATNKVPHNQFAQALLALDKGSTQEQAAEKAGLSLEEVRDCWTRFSDKRIFIFPKELRVFMKPQERTKCKDIAATKKSPHSQFAQALLALDAGNTEQQAAKKTGLSLEEVRDCRARFLKQRLDIFPKELLKDKKKGKPDSSKGKDKPISGKGKDKPVSSKGKGKPDTGKGTSKTDTGKGKGKSDSGKGKGKPDTGKGKGKSDSSKGKGKPDSGKGKGKGKGPKAKNKNKDKKVKKGKKN